MPRKRIAYISGDEVNSAKACQTVFIDETVVDAVPLRAWLPEGSVDASAYDLDHILPEQRKMLLGELTSDAPRHPTAVHSYDLDAAQIRNLRARGVLVGRWLEASLLQSLASLIPSGRRQAG